MDTAETLKRTIAVITEVLDLDEGELNEGSSAADVEDWDSITTIEIAIALEREFDIRFRTGEMATFRNIGAVAERIHAHAEGK